MSGRTYAEALEDLLNVAQTMEDMNDQACPQRRYWSETAFEGRIGAGVVLRSPPQNHLRTLMNFGGVCYDAGETIEIAVKTINHPQIVTSFRSGQVIALRMPIQLGSTLTIECRRIFTTADEPVVLCLSWADACSGKPDRDSVVVDRPTVGLGLSALRREDAGNGRN